MLFSCHFCAKRFPHKSHMKAHTKTVHEEKIIKECLHCRLFFSSKEELKQHNFEAHEKQKPFVCESVKKAILDKRAWQTTLKVLTMNMNIKNDEQCQLFMAKFTDSSELKNHVLQVHENVENQMKAFLDCTVCDLTFISIPCIINKDIRALHVKFNLH